MNFNALKRNLFTRIDRLQAGHAIIMGVLIGAGIGGWGLLYLHSSLWILFWCALFAGLWRLGHSAEPILVEKQSDPIFEKEEPRPLVKEATQKIQYQESPSIERHPKPVQDGPLKMMELPPGTFLMGSPSTDNWAYDNEKPQHEVTVSSFRIGVTPITVEMYHNNMGTGKNKTKSSSSLPVTKVSWFDAILFCNKLSERQNYSPCYQQKDKDWLCDWDADGYRLPTEAEWEYACRAGSKTHYSFGDDPEDLNSYAWHRKNSEGNVRAVALKSPNAWGLFDMHGTIWEWCWDWFGDYTEVAKDNPPGPVTGIGRVVRGGSVWNTPRNLRSVRRVGVDPEFRRANFGFRCVRVPPQFGR